MPDGVPIAIDVYLPKDRPGPLPTILHQTRYFRAVAMRRGLSWIPLAKAMDTDYATRQRFLAAGYAWVSVCVRGSGASGGTSPFPWSEPEVDDGVRVLDWIIQQPWSNGRVGSTGISYSGTSAEHLAARGHPALLAIAPRFSCFDVYADVALPGGIHLESFTRAWGQLNRLLDSGDIAGAVALNLALAGRGCGDLGRSYWSHRAAAHPVAQRLIRAVVRALSPGVAAVDGDRGRTQVAAAIAAHRDNDDIHEGALRVTYRGDAGVSARVPNATVDAFSPHRRAKALRDSGVAVLGYSGWLDGGYARAACHRHEALGGSGRLVLGPWNHGGQQDISPFTPPGPARDDHSATLLAFFDEHVRGLPPPEAPPAVRYYTLGEERWRTADTWPPRECTTVDWFLSEGGRLERAAPSREGVQPYSVDPAVGTGHRARWNSLLGVSSPIGYPDGAALCARAACFASAPLDRSTVVTGAPRATLRLTADQPDASVFVYLVDVAPSGRATIVTEGQLRLVHRQDGEPVGSILTRTFAREHARPMPIGLAEDLRIELLPVSYRFAAGHSVCLAVTGADADHFRPVTTAPVTLGLGWGGESAARLSLPVMV